MSCTVQLDDETYRLVSNGIEGDEVEYGDTAFVFDASRVYYCTIAEAPDENEYDSINVFCGTLEPCSEVAPTVNLEIEGSQVCIDCTCRIVGAFKADFTVEEVSGLDGDDDEGPDDDDGEALPDEDEEEEDEDQEAVA